MFGFYRHVLFATLCLDLCLWRISFDIGLVDCPCLGIIDHGHLGGISLQSQGIGNNSSVAILGTN